jgi:hypothetical protein
MYGSCFVHLCLLVMDDSSAALRFEGHLIRPGAFLVLSVPQEQSVQSTILVRLEEIRRLSWSANEAAVSQCVDTSGSVWLLFRQLYNERTRARPIAAERPLHHFDIYSKLAELDVCPLNDKWRVRGFLSTARLLRLTRHWPPGSISCSRCSIRCRGRVGILLS